MHLMRIGNLAVNLDRALSISYVEDMRLPPGYQERGPSLSIQWGDTEAAVDTVVYGEDARAAWRVIRALCRYGETEPPADGEGPAYLIRWSGVWSDLIPCRDLGALQGAVGVAAREGVRGRYPIEGPPGEEWGAVTIDAPDRWRIASHDGSVIVLPGAFIL